MKTARLNVLVVAAAVASWGCYAGEGLDGAADSDVSDAADADGDVDAADADSGDGGDAGTGDPCDEEAQCQSGLKCCYPCGIQGCHNVCTEPVDGGGCPLPP